MKRTILTGTIATATMTAFSYALSKMAKDNWREPELLNRFVHARSLSVNDRSPDGWLLHLALGWAWAAVYRLARTRIPRRKGRDIAFGFVSGTVAIVAWKTLLAHHPAPPVKQRAFYGHLFIAHLLFTCSLSSMEDAVC